MNDTEYIASIITPLVQYPDSFKVDKKIDEKGILLTVSVDPSDMGKVIGRLGVTANSIRILMRQFGITNNLHISLKIDDQNK